MCRLLLYTHRIKKLLTACFLSSLSLSLSQSGYRGQCIWTVNSARSVRHPENRASFVLNRTAQTRQSSLPWRDSFSSINHQPLVLVDRTTHACILLCLPPNECFRVEDTIRILFHFILYYSISLLIFHHNDEQS